MSERNFAQDVMGDVLKMVQAVRRAFETNARALAEDEDHNVTLPPPAMAFNTQNPAVKQIMQYGTQSSSIPHNGHPFDPYDLS